MANEQNYSTKDLKAIAYDLIANIDYLQKQLNSVNNQIAKKSEEEKKNGTANDNSNS